MKPATTLAHHSGLPGEATRATAPVMPVEPMRYRRTLELEDLMHLQIIMDTSGDTRHRFDPDDARAVAEAEKRFGDMIGAGFIAAKRKGNGTSELVRHFDPAAQETVFIPRLVGG
jgi:hypothetical protein